ncbi:hypothetical protein E4U56_002150 [Claviceps arundinis]|uniref:Uncharacterized protein n=1 Tax=Claviceps arundinis TaxID=1623583 RepID=A0A9P7MPG8_9HYPO|nr:hypothetical protein E4U56_002150 [Claviceps arundinis]
MDWKQARDDPSAEPDERLEEHHRFKAVVRADKKRFWEEVIDACENTNILWEIEVWHKAKARLDPPPIQPNGSVVQDSVGKAKALWLPRKMTSLETPLKTGEVRTRITAWLGLRTLRWRSWKWPPLDLSIIDSYGAGCGQHNDQSHVAVLAPGTSSKTGISPLCGGAFSFHISPP